MIHNSQQSKAQVDHTFIIEMGLILTFIDTHVYNKEGHIYINLRLREKEH